MPKIFVQDIVPSGKRSIRNIPLPKGKAASAASTDEREREARDESNDQPKKRANSSNSRPERSEKAEKPSKKEKTGRGFSGIGLWVFGVIILAVLIYVGSFFFVTATVTITPKEVNTPVSVSGKAQSDSASATTATSATGTPADELTYTIVTLTREGGKTVPAGSEEKVEKKATGKIVVYNDYSIKPQILVANTRFETSNGLIFRIPQQITVPGQKVGANGATTPGSIAVTVSADVAGDKYNIGLADFTIPGFKGDPRYAKFSAKSDPSSPIAGGMVGTARKVTPADTAAAKVSIETQLKKELQTALQAQIPDTHVLFSTASTFDFADLPQEAGGANGTATVKEKGSIYGILFDKKELSHYLATRQAQVGNKDVSIANLGSFTFNLDNPATFSPTATKEISFKISGTADFVWNVDSMAVSEALTSQKRSNIKPILAGFESVDRASVAIHPLWLITTPKNPDKIRVEIEPTI